MRPTRRLLIVYPPAVGQYLLGTWLLGWWWFVPGLLVILAAVLWSALGFYR